MTTLLLFLPPRSRLRAQGRPTMPDGNGRGVAGDLYEHLLVASGGQIVSRGPRAAGALPPATTVIAIAAESDLAWQRVKLPRAGRQMRAALAGQLEESLLDDPDSLHFALQPDAGGGDTAWVAVCSRAWLAQHLTQLEAADVFVDRVAPLAWPGAPMRGHFHAGDDGSGNGDGETAPLKLLWCHPDGLVELPLDGELARALLFTPQPPPDIQWTATPAVAARAEHWLGAAVTVLTPEQRALAVIDSRWDLRQFELAQRTRGIRALRQLGRELMQRRWAPVRWGLAGLVAVQLLGLNLLAWKQAQALQAQRAAQTATLKTSYPQVRAVLDAPVQMRRETEALRASAGRAGDDDLETLLAAAAAAWPAGRGPIDALSFEPGRLVLSAKDWEEAQIQQFRSQLRNDGWQLDSGDGRMSLHRRPRNIAGGSAGVTL
jgi:general secretion pathway protein L